jgi:hypothetical protein
MDPISKEQRTWAMFAHLSAFAMYLTGIGHILGPLIVWLLKREGNPFVDDQGKEALNFNISYSLYLICAVILAFTLVGLLVAIPALLILPILHIIFMIVGAIKANDGVPYRYPATIRFL